MGDNDIGQKGMRSSNIELLRIVAMMSIIAHHYVVHSTMVLNPVYPTVNTLFLQLWGMWGKTAINVFVLITGYFMCENRLTVRRYLKILFEVLFYSWIVWLILAFFGHETLSWGGALKKFFLYELFTGQNRLFVPAFMWMYLLIPFMNIFISAASRKDIYICIAVLLAMFTGCGTFMKAAVFHHVGWYMTLYILGASIRKYPFAWMSRNRICVPLLTLMVLAAWASVVGIDQMGVCLGRRTSPYFFMTDSHKILAFSVALFAFLVFKNWKVPPSRFINVVASTTFGVFLIHDATDGMRKWLWLDLVNVPKAYTMSLLYLIGYSIVVMLCVFVVCSALDYLRIRFVEKPLFRLFALKKST